MYRNALDTNVIGSLIKHEKHSILELLQFLKQSEKLLGYTDYYYSKIHYNGKYYNLNDVDNLISSYDCCDYDYRIFKQACKLKMKKYISKILVQKNDFKKECVFDILHFDDEELFKLIIITTQYKLDIVVLEEACKLNSINIMKFILNNKISPSKTCLKNVVIGNLEKHDYKLNNEAFGSVLTIYGEKYCYVENYHNIKYKIGNYEYDSKIATMCIELLIQYGYKITQEDVINCILSHIKINNIENMNVELDSKVYDACITANFQISDKLANKMMTDIKGLRNACKNSSLNIVRQITKSGIKLDNECLRLACSRKGNLPMIRYIVENQNLPLDTKCLLECVSLIKNKQAKYMVESFIKCDDEKQKRNQDQDQDDSDEEEPKKVNKKKPKKLKIKINNDSDEEQKKIKNIEQNDSDEKSKKVKNREQDDSDEEPKKVKNREQDDLDEEPKKVNKKPEKAKKAKKAKPEKIQNQ
jgi:hypothetical protein